MFVFQSKFVSIACLCPLNSSAPVGSAPGCCRGSECMSQTPPMPEAPSGTVSTHQRTETGRCWGSYALPESAQAMAATFPGKVHSLPAQRCTDTSNHILLAWQTALALLRSEPPLTEWRYLPNENPGSFSFREKPTYGKRSASPKEGYAHIWSDFKMGLFWKGEFIHWELYSIKCAVREKCAWSQFSNVEKETTQNLRKAELTLLETNECHWFPLSLNLVTRTVKIDEGHWSLDAEASSICLYRWHCLEERIKLQAF